MFTALRSFFSSRAAAGPAPERARLKAERMPAALYAIGDVHGCLSALLELENRIAADAREIEGEKWLVLLGDYVDRGPNSAGVLDHLSAAPPDGFKRICLLGNHDTAMLEAVRDGLARPHWLQFGGLDTLQSYGIALDARQAARPWGKHFDALLQSHIPDEHLEWLAGLPLCLQVDEYVFVHAGIRPGVPLEQQSEEDLLWIRDSFLSVELDPAVTIVHGHTPSPVPLQAPGRIGIDTGCFATGRLTAVRLIKGRQPEFLDNLFPEQEPSSPR